jgi:predicted DNA-binding transcriptional regulator AlpA
MPFTLMKGRARERLASRRSATRIPDPHAADAVTVTDRTIAGTNTSAGTAVDRLLTTKDAADLLRLSVSWLAKARMRGDGPPYVKLGGSIRYLQSTLFRWMKVQQRLSTSE